MRSDGPKPMDTGAYYVSLPPFPTSNLRDLIGQCSVSMVALYPRTELPIKETSTDKRNWVHMLKDSQDSATFAVMSPRCLEYEYVNTGNTSKVWRRCLDSRENQTRLHDFEQKGVVTNRNRTLLYTTLQLHPTACHLRNASYTMEHSAI